VVEVGVDETDEAEDDDTDELDDDSDEDLLLLLYRSVVELDEVVAVGPLFVGSRTPLDVVAATDDDAVAVVGGGI
jgi:hypothetical protein